MSQKTSFMINSVDGTAQLNLLVGGQLETQYSFANGGFILSERPNVAALNFKDYTTNVGFIDHWHKMIKEFIGFTPGQLGNYYENLSQNSNGTFTATCQIEGIMAGNASFQGNTITFQPRPQLILNPKKFLKFLGWLTYLQSL